MAEIEATSSPENFILVGTKNDVRDNNNSDHVSPEEGNKLGKQIGAYKLFTCSSKKYCSSNKMLGNINDLFKAAMAVCLINREVIEGQNEWVCTKFCNIL